MDVVNQNQAQGQLVTFCTFFLEVALDQIQYMTSVLSIDDMLSRLRGLVQLLVFRRKWRPEMYYVLEAVFLNGSIPRREVERLTGLSERTAKALATQLLQAGLLATDKDDHLAPYRAAYPIEFAPALFPGLYPAGKEVDMLNVG